jgi:hypothetical protein
MAPQTDINGRGVDPLPPHCAHWPARAVPSDCRNRAYGTYPVARRPRIPTQYVRGRVGQEHNIGITIGRIACLNPSITQVTKGEIRIH